MAISFNKYSNPYIPLHNRLTAYSGPLENHLLNRHKFKMVKEKMQIGDRDKKKKSDIHKAFLRFQMTRKQGHFFSTYAAVIVFGFLLFTVSSKTK